jgi:probable HAF family extracellular repeat protein
MRLRLTTALGVLALLVACSEPYDAPEDLLASKRSRFQATVTDLVTPGAQRSRAEDINARGQIAGEVEVPGFRAVTWLKGTMTDLGVPPGYVYGQPQAINSAGTVVGWAQLQGEGDQGHAFAWEHGLKRDLGVLPGDVNSMAHAINSAGDIVGVSTKARLNTERAVLWRKGEIINLGTLTGDIASEAFGIDAAGRVFGYSLRPTFDWRPFMWNRGVMTELSGLDQFSITRRGDIVAWKCPDEAGDPGAKSTRRVGMITYIPCPKQESDDLIDINDINSSGQAVGALYRRQIPFGAWRMRPFLWSAGQSTPLPLLSGDPEGEANAINERGQIVGLSSSGPTLRGVLWTVK